MSRSRLSRRAALFAAFALFAVLGGVAFAIPDSSGTFQACYANGDGAVRLVDKQPTDCLAGESGTQWSQAGPAGATGAPGAAGAAGPAGPSGLPGTAGAAGARGAAGTAGVPSVARVAYNSDAFEAGGTRETTTQVVIPHRRGRTGPWRLLDSILLTSGRYAVFGRVQLRIKDENPDHSHQQEVRCRIGTAGRTGGVSDWVEVLVMDRPGFRPAQTASVSLFGTADVSRAVSTQLRLHCLVWTAQADTRAEWTEVTAWGARLMAIKVQTLEVDDD